MKIIDIPQSGKIGLQVAMPCRFGQVWRAWIVPANPRTPSQLIVRSTLTQQAQRFRSLTTAQQDAWTAAAASVQTRSRLGQSGPLTGPQLFARINCNLRLAGQDALDAPSPRPQFPDMAPQSLVITNTAGAIALKLACLGDPGETTFIRAAKPVSSAVRRLPSLRTIGTCPAAVAGAADITTLYTAKFGVPTPGDRVFVECYSMVDGWQSAPVVFSALVPTA